MQQRRSSASTLIVIPTYNEAGNLPVLIQRLRETVLDADILIVDDGSPDGTGDIAQDFAYRDPAVHVLKRRGERGLGLAYLDGFRLALAREYESVVQLDADLSHPVDAIPGLLRMLEEFDLVIGSRYLPGSSITNWSLQRLALSRVSNIYIRAVAGIPLRDVTGGFKCMRREVLEKIDLDTIRSNGFAFQIEVNWKAHACGLRICECPIVFVGRNVGCSKLDLPTMSEIARLPWRLRFAS